MEEFVDNSEWPRSACTSTHFSALTFGTSCESSIKIKETSYLYSLPKRLKLRSLLANPDDQGSLQKTHWRSSTSCRKVWWLDNAWSQGPQQGGWIRKQSPIRCRRSRSCHSVDSILPVQNEDFTGDGEELTKVPRAVTQTKSCKNWQLDGIWESM